MTWRDRIQRAREKGFTSDDKRDAHCNWMKCAVGEQQTLLGPLQIVMRVNGSAGPEDDVLFDLGYEFGLAVWENRVDDAERYLDQIEDRALELKRRMG